MTKRLAYLHCGLHRTGTTKLQQVLSASREALKNRGLIYPFDGPNHQAIVNQIKTNKLTGKGLAEKLTALSDNPEHRFILSGEDFSSIGRTDWLAQLHEEMDVKIIFYLRRQDLWMNSWYNQHIKWPWNHKQAISASDFIFTLPEFFWIDFYKRLEGWRARIGRDNIHVKVVGKGQLRDTVADFTDFIGMPIQELNAGQANDNSSIAPMAVEIIRHLGLLEYDPQVRRTIIDSITRNLPAEARQADNMMFSPAQRRWILQQFQQSNEKVAREYFGRADGMLFEDAEIADDATFSLPQLPPSADLLRYQIRPLIKTLVEKYKP